MRTSRVSPGARPRGASWVVPHWRALAASARFDFPLRGKGSPSALADWAKRARFGFVLLACLCDTFPAWAQANEWHGSGYELEPPSALEVVDALKVETAVIVGAVTYGGIKAWRWGTRPFRFHSEGWFGMDTPHGGIDKTGHLFNTYVLGELFYLRLSEYYGGQRVLSVYPAALALTIMTYIEIADGFSVDHGFSPEDFTADVAGAAMSALRDSVPEVGDTLDLRFEYMPSKSVHGLHPFKDYSGQKFLAVVKPAGIPVLRDTPLRYAEFSLGYLTRGFKVMDQPYYANRTTELFLGVGVSLEQLLFKPLAQHAGKPFTYVNTASHYFQVPYTYFPFTLDQRSRPQRFLWIEQ